ncbi:hypothetical protein L7F22_048935 [Adiantum nelumboides]|nr:hypothetical protein [Adiantum nelumboides]
MIRRLFTKKGPLAFFRGEKERSNSERACEKGAEEEEEGPKREGMKKRRLEGGGLEDVERTLHSSFCAAANSISHLYTQAQTQHKIAFQAGQRHALEKLYDWIHKHHLQNGILPSSTEILNYVKMELEIVNQTEITIAQVQSPPLFSQQNMDPPNSFGRS